MIDLVISGAAGRMGQAIARTALAAGDVRIVGALGASDRPYLGKDIGELAGVGHTGVAITADSTSVPTAGTVWLAFSTPDATMAHARHALTAGAGLVVGTTGLSQDQLEELTGLAHHAPLLIAPNTSLGAIVLFFLAETAARALGSSFDIEIIEAHHRLKRDAPSGTARRLAERVATARDQAIDAVARYGRAPDAGRRSSGEIGVHAIRAGDIVGEHTALFADTGERLELTHRVGSIDTFARGALLAARFLDGQAPGLFTMEQALGLVSV